MTVRVKICGLKDATHVRAAVEAGADMVGFNFVAKSPRYVTPNQAAFLAALADSITRVGLLVNPDDETVATILASVPLNFLQLHGDETPGRVAAIKQKFTLPVMKAIAIGTADDIAKAKSYEPVADYLLFDAKPRPDDAVPGGNGRVFDWQLLRGEVFTKPWLLAGGLTPDNVAEAIKISSAPGVDVSSGVETAPGQKDVDLTKKFIAAARSSG